MTAANGKIPLVDLGAQYRAHRFEFDAALAECLDRTSFIGGPDHRAFAEEFAEWCGGGYAALVGNGTDALILAIEELLGRGDGTEEIITVSHTFIATTEAISGTGYRPVLVDVDPDTCLMNLDGLETAIGPKTRAVIPVHLYGQMVQMDALMQIARRYDLKVIEDAAQAHGATWQGHRPGILGDAATFSFYPGKNLGAWGDAGAIYTRDAALSESITARANHGRQDKYLHQFEGVNSRLDGLQAAILRVKLRHIDAWNAARREVASWYDELLAGYNSIRLPQIREEAEHVFHLYVVQVEERDRIREYLNDRGIGAGVHYPVPLHEQPALAYLGLKSEDLPVTSKLGKTILSLPIYPELTRAQAERVVATLVEAVDA
ncbi:MAG: hypothetical protein CMB11_06075 [Euryarchaeota archaeon]|nr:hypothetical protein [Euryarchaeota archaeon]